ncbi:MAG: hypothetical protein E7592_04010 [Ruminococcaceae bacterium]|nr:hypothetical protein [Oscillospiraceae bacterium]
MLNKKFIVSALVLTMCTSALLASCGDNGGMTGNAGNESTVETTKKTTNDNVVGEIGSDVGNMADDVINGAGNIVDDVTDGNREDATHGTESENKADTNEGAKQHRAPSYNGK